MTAADPTRNEDRSGTNNNNQISSMHDQPTIFDPATCLRRGLCQVSRARAPKTHNLYYEVHGTELPAETAQDVKYLVFIMGLNNSSFGWHNQIRHFGRKPGYRSLVIDNRGVGYSDAPWGLYKTSEMAKDIEELLDFLGWDRPHSLHLIGVSMGGMIAQELALLILDRVASLSLISTTAGNKATSPVSLVSYRVFATFVMVALVTQISGVKMFARLFFVKDARSMIRIVVNGLYPQSYLEAPDEMGREETNRDRLEKEFMARYEITRKQPLSGRLSQTFAALGHHVKPDELSILDASIPKITIMTGDEDTIVHPERSKDLHEFLPHSEYILFEGGGHALPSQFADRLNATLERTIDEAANKLRTGHW